MAKLLKEIEELKNLLYWKVFSWGLNTHLEYFLEKNFLKEYQSSVKF